MTELVVMEMTDARALTDRIKVSVEAVWELIKQAYVQRAWSALGYSSWDDYCNREFGASRLRLPREERAEVVSSLRESGLSIRAIASATGDGYGTIRRELGREPIGSPEPVVTGLDGKTYRRELPVHPLCEMFPWISDTEIQSMADSIARFGLINPLTMYVDDGVEYLLDGKLRRAACRIAGVEPTFKRYEGADPQSFVISMNVERHHFNEGQRAFIAVGLAELYQEHDRSIDKDEEVSLRARWEFGRELTEKRDDNGHLPDGFMTQLMAATGKSRSELLYRERFAAAYPTEAELSHAVTEFGSWDRVVEHLKVMRRHIADGWA